MLNLNWKYTKKQLEIVLNVPGYKHEKMQDSGSAGSPVQDEIYVRPSK